MSQSFCHDWHIVTEFTGVTGPAEDAFDCLDAFIDAAGLPCTRLQCDSTSRAVVLRLGALCTATKSFNDTMLIASMPDTPIDPEEEVIFVAATGETGNLEHLFALLDSGTGNMRRPNWAGVLTSSVGAQTWLAALSGLGVSEPRGTLRLQEKTGAVLVFDLYRIPPHPTQSRQALARGAAQKIPEGPDNLQRRAKWFQRRSGPSTQ
jgi:hypothetical protein